MFHSSFTADSLAFPYGRRQTFCSSSKHTENSLQQQAQAVSFFHSSAGDLLRIRHSEGLLPALPLMKGEIILLPLAKHRNFSTRLKELQVGRFFTVNGCGLQVDGERTNSNSTLFCPVQESEDTVKTAIQDHNFISHVKFTCFMQTAHIQIRLRIHHTKPVSSTASENNR